MRRMPLAQQRAGSRARLCTHASSHPKKTVRSCIRRHTRTYCLPARYKLGDFGLATKLTADGLPKRLDVQEGDSVCVYLLLRSLSLCVYFFVVLHVTRPSV